MNHTARRLTTLAVLTLGIGIAAYSLRSMSDFHTRPGADPNQVIELGTIVVTPKDASPPLTRSEARYAMNEKHRRLYARERSEDSL